MKLILVPQLVLIHGSVIQNSRMSGDVIPLFVKGENDPLWFSVSFKTSKTEVHSVCPTFGRCPKNEDQLVTIVGEEMGSHNGVFDSRIHFPNFQDVAGRLGLGMLGNIAKKNVIKISSVGSSLVLWFEKKQTSDRLVARFNTGADNAWKSRVSWSFGINGGAEHPISKPLDNLTWEPLKEGIQLPNELLPQFYALGMNVVESRLYMPCNVWENGKGPDIELIAEENLFIVPIVPIEDTNSRKSIAPICATNLVFSDTSGAIVGIKSLLDKYDVELDASTRSVRFIEKQINTVVPEYPIYPGLHAFRISDVTEQGWIWKRSNTWGDKDFIFTSNWPFSGDVEFFSKNLRYDENIVVPPQVEWTGTAKYELLPGGDIAVSQVFGREDISLVVLHRCITFTVKGVRYVWSKIIMDGPDQEMVAEPIISGPPQKDEFVLPNWPLVLEPSTIDLRMISRYSKNEGVWGLWFGLPVFSIDPASNTLTIKAQYNDREYVVRKWSERLDFSTEIERYTPIWTPNDRFDLVRVSGYQRYPIEVQISDLEEFEDHLEITLTDVPDRSGMLAQRRPLAYLDQLEVPGRPMLQISDNHVSIKFVTENGPTHVTVQSRGLSSIISFYTKSTRFHITGGLDLMNNRVVIPRGEPYGKLKARDFIFTSPRVTKLFEGKWELRFSNYKPTLSRNGPFRDVGKWDGIPTIEIDKTGNLVISAIPDGNKYFIEQTELDNELVLTFETLAVRKLGPVASLLTVTPTEALEDNQCAICLERFREGEILAQLKVCKHRLHIDCLSSLRQRDNHKCPMCRRDMIPK